MSLATPERLLQRLDWTVIRRLDGLLQGEYRSLFTGTGLDLAEIREYTTEDDIRYMDWNVTARMGTPYVREYHEDREINAWFLLDLSPSVDFGTVNALKRDYLIEFVGVMSRLLTRHGNRVGAIFYGSHVDKVIPASGGKLQVLRLINDLQHEPKLKRAPFTSLSTLLVAANNFIRRRSLVFIVSDFISEPGWDKPLRLMTQKHEVLSVRLWDPREVEMPDIGMIVIEDAETGEQLFVDTHDRKFRERFTQAARKREQEVNNTFKRAGVDVLSLSTEEDLVKAILRFANLRKERKAHPAKGF
jgi:uncharacterized protein (DUF58 family)